MQFEYSGGPEARAAGRDDEDGRLYYSNITIVILLLLILLLLVLCYCSNTTI